MSAHDILIREAVVDDIDSCATLIAHHESGDVDSWRARFESDLANPLRKFFVALQGTEIVGYGHCVLHSRADDADEDASPSGYFLSGLLVAPTYRRGRIGTLLTTVRLEALRGLTDVVYYVADPRNVATIGLHKRLGFSELRPVTRDGARSLLFRFDFV